MEEERRKEETVEMEKKLNALGEKIEKSIDALIEPVIIRLEKVNMNQETVNTKLVEMEMRMNEMEKKEKEPEKSKEEGRRDQEDWPILRVMEGDKVIM